MAEGHPTPRIGEMVWLDRRYKVVMVQHTPSWNGIPSTVPSVYLLPIIETAGPLCSNA